MERNQIRNLLDVQAQRCMELSDKLRYEGSEPLEPEDHKLIRVATLPALQEAFEVGLTHYLVYGEAKNLMEGMGEVVHEG